jgi:hypothetical protein
MAPNRYLFIPGLSYTQTFRPFSIALRTEGEVGLRFYSINAGLQLSF